MRRVIGRACRAVGCTLLLFSMLLRLFSVHSLAETTVYRSVATDSRQIALTFDDGPHPRQTPRILEILERYRVCATFFMIGQNVEYYPDTARAVLAAGHEVGNHTFSHLHLKNLTQRTLDAEVGKCEDALEELCEYRPHLFRPPEGALTPFVEHCSEKSDYSLILWSIDTRDWEGGTAEEIAQRVLSRVRPGDIILMHDYIGRQSATPEALEILLPALLSQGYEPVTVSRLLGFGY